MDDLGTFLHQLGGFVFRLTVWILVIVGVFDATRKLASFGYSKRLALFVAGYLILSGLAGGFYYWVYQKEVQLLAGLDFRHQQLPQDWAKDTALVERYKGSKAYATAAFRGEGVLLKHLDASGKWIEFQPTAEDIARRDATVAVTTRLAEQSQLFWRLALECWLGAVIAAAIGFFVGRGWGRLATNSTAESDARKSSARGSP